MEVVGLGPLAAQLLLLVAWSRLWGLATPPSQQQVQHTGPCMQQAQRIWGRHAQRLRVCMQQQGLPAKLLGAPPAGGPMGERWQAPPAGPGFRVRLVGAWREV